MAAAWFANRQTIKAAEAATKNETLKVQTEAYERARKMYESGIHQLEDQLERLRKQLPEEQNVSSVCAIRYRN